MLPVLLEVVSELGQKGMVTELWYPESKEKTCAFLSGSPAYEMLLPTFRAGLISKANFSLEAFSWIDGEK